MSAPEAAQGASKGHFIPTYSSWLNQSSDSSR